MNWVAIGRRALSDKLKVSFGFLPAGIADPNSCPLVIVICWAAAGAAETGLGKMTYFYQLSTSCTHIRHINYYLCLYQILVSSLIQIVSLDKPCHPPGRIGPLEEQDYLNIARSTFEPQFYISEKIWTLLCPSRFNNYGRQFQIIWKDTQIWFFG